MCAFTHIFFLKKHPIHKQTPISARNAREGSARRTSLFFGGWAGTGEKCICRKETLEILVELWQKELCFKGIVSSRWDPTGMTAPFSSQLSEPEHNRSFSISPLTVQREAQQLRSVSVPTTRPLHVAGIEEVANNGTA